MDNGGYCSRHWKQKKQKVHGHTVSNCRLSAGTAESNTGMTALISSVEKNTESISKLVKELRTDITEIGVESANMMIEEKAFTVEYGFGKLDSGASGNFRRATESEEGIADEWHCDDGWEGFEPEE